jgi:C4-dicarboxylate-specific signal transduction histidine kinase
LKKDNIVERLEDFLDGENGILKENIHLLIKEYKRKSARLDKIIGQSDAQYSKLLKLNEELDDHKKNLQLKVEEEIEKREEKEKMLMQQARLASMGEMMDAVAHQWKQPIGTIGMMVDLLGYDFEDGDVDKKYIKEFQENVSAQIQHITSTLTEFRSFFRPSKDASDFDVAKMLEKVLLLVKDEFMKYTIELDVHIVNDFTLYGIENEFKHLIINIINNAKDAFIENKIKNRKIIITIFEENGYKKLSIKDNAGGVPQHIIKDIFKANVTSKAEGKGTGIGLYMSFQIAQKHHGELSVQNVENGAEFIFMHKINPS